MNMDLDFSKLKGRIREKGLTQADLAKMIGITPATMNLKLNNKSDFTLKETVAIALALDIAEPYPYFFCFKS